MHPPVLLPSRWCGENRPDRCRLLLHVVDIAATDGREPADDIDKINTELTRYSSELAARPQIIVANKVDSADMDSDAVKAFKRRVLELGCEVVYVSAVTGEGLDELVSLSKKMLRDLPPVAVYEPEYTPEEAAVSSVREKITEIRKEGNKYIVEGEWLFNLMGQINFSDYESLNFFQRVLIKNGVIDKLREAGVNEGDTVSIYDFEFDFVY